MLLLRLWNYLRGYVIILVKGYFLEKFLNICTHRQILLWDIKRHKENEISLKISIKGFKLIRPVAKKTKCKVEIVKKRGLPFIFNRYHKRKAFVIGAALFIILIFLMTSFVWSIEITGNKDLQTSYIENALSLSGIKPGVLKYKINTDRAITQMMIAVKELSWISIEVKGTKVKVQLRERKASPVIVDKNAPCNIVAKKDAFIKQILATNGTESVSVGDTVNKGQVLISGRVPIKNEKDKFKLVHAMGSVKARVWYEEECPVEYQKIEKVRTGRELSNYSLVLFSKRFDLFHKKASYKNYDRDVIKKSLSIGEDFVFPFELIIERYCENNLVNVQVSVENAKNAAIEEAYKKVMEMVPEEANIIKKDVGFVDDEEKGLTAKVTIECVEEIGVAEEIGGN